MSNRPFTFEEELVRQAADFHFPTAGLRSRVMAAAERAATHRLRVRRTCIAAMLLAWFAGSIVWGRPFIESAFQARARAADAVTDAGSPEVFAAQSRVAMCSLGEWGHVECFVHLRQLQSQILRGAY
jgi:hypothetical protein